MTFFTIFLFCQIFFKSPQWYDVLFYENKQYYVYSKDIISATDYPFTPVIKKLYRNPAQKYKIDSLLTCVTSCNRGYVATWEIQNDSLKLKKLNNFKNGFSQVELDFIFEEQEIQNGVFANWFTGFIRLIESPYETDIIHYFIIKDGIVIKTRK